MFPSLLERPKARHDKGLHSKLAKTCDSLPYKLKGFVIAGARFIACHELPPSTDRLPVPSLIYSVRRYPLSPMDLNTRRRLLVGFLRKLRRANALRPITLSSLTKRFSRASASLGWLMRGLADFLEHLMNLLEEFPTAALSQPSMGGSGVLYCS